MVDFFVKCEPKSITIKRTKDLNYFVHLIYIIHEFHNLNLIIEKNLLFHILIWDAPVCMHVCV